MSRVLIVEDDNDIHQLLVDILAKEEKYQCDSAYSGTEALRLIGENQYDLLLLDLMLPGKSGEDIMQEISGQFAGGVIVLSAKSEMEDKVALLRLGADDYLTKPFHRAELLARIESVLRRYQNPAASQEQSDQLVYRDLVLDTDSREITIQEKPLHLTTTEFDLLHLLMSAPKKVFTRENLYQSLWGADQFIEDNAINVHISNIRKKIAEHTQEPYIETVWGIGFKMC